MIRMYNYEEIESLCNKKLNINWSDIKINLYTEFIDFKNIQLAYFKINNCDGRLNPKEFNKNELAIKCINCKLIFEYMMENSNNYKKAYGNILWKDTIVNKLLVALNNHIDYSDFDTDIQHELKRNNLENKL